MDDRKRLPKRENSTKLMSNSKHVRKEIETSSSSSEIPCNQIKKAYSISITEREHISSSNSQLPNFKVSTEHEKDFETDGLIEEKAIITWSILIFDKKKFFVDILGP